MMEPGVWIVINRTPYEQAVSTPTDHNRTSLCCGWSRSWSSHWRSCPCTTRGLREEDCMRRRTFLVAMAAAFGVNLGQIEEGAMAETLKQVTLRIEGMT